MHQPRDVVDRLADEERLDGAQRRDGALGGERRRRLADAGDAGVGLHLDEHDRAAVVHAAGPVIRLLEGEEERRETEPVMRTGRPERCPVDSRSPSSHSSVSRTCASRTCARVNPVAYSADCARRTRASSGSRPTTSLSRIGHAGDRGALADRADDVGHRGHPVVGQVHRDLHGAVLEQQAHRLDALHAAVALADLDGDALRQIEVVRVEIHVEGDEREARADGDGPGRRVHARLALVRRLRGIAADDVAHLLEALAADHGEVAVLGHPGRVLVEERGDLEVGGDAARQHRARPRRRPASPRSAAARTARRRRRRSAGGRPRAGSGR